jgi:hypothetical protein
MLLACLEDLWWNQFRMTCFKRIAFTLARYLFTSLFFCFAALTCLGKVALLPFSTSLVVCILTVSVSMLLFQYLEPKSQEGIIRMKTINE